MYLAWRIGTGIGAGVLADERPLHGLAHTRSGYSLAPYNGQSDPFLGICWYHGNCWEGLASRGYGYGNTFGLIKIADMIRPSIVEDHGQPSPPWAI